MLKKIILIILAIIFIGCVIVFFWKKQIINPNQEIIYLNKTYNYNLKIPKEWANKYKIIEKENKVSFFYNIILPSTAVQEENLLFSITVYSKNEWEKIEKENKEAEEKGLTSGCCLKVFAKKNEKIFVYNISISNPYGFYNKEVADKFNKMTGQVQKIITSFSVINQ